MSARSHRLLTGLLSLALVTLTHGCVSTTPTAATLLLEQDYRQMNDVQLTAYEQQLSDEIDRTVRRPSGDVTVGFGFGSWGTAGGVGVHTDRRVSGGAEASSTAELRARRDQVRTEMRRRGLIP